jgi:transcription elongation GreA/GreB family factor
MAPIRSILLSRLREGLETRRAAYVRELASLDEAAARETKSSAGDKYETAREMIAQSRRLIEGNLAEIAAGLAALERMAAPGGPGIGFGSLVETSHGWYLLGASLGEIEVEGALVRTASLASPLGAALRGKGPGDRVPWRGGSLEVRSVAV